MRKKICILIILITQFLNCYGNNKAPFIGKFEIIVAFKVNINGSTTNIESEYINSVFQITADAFLIDEEIKYFYKEYTLMEINETFFIRSTSGSMQGYSTFKDFHFPKEITIISECMLQLKTQNKKTSPFISSFFYIVTKDIICFGGNKIHYIGKRIE